MYVWWPGIDGVIKRVVRLCHECQACQSSPPHAPLHSWQWPTTRPWVRLLIHYAGPICGKMSLIVVDAHSKWIEAIPFLQQYPLLLLRSYRHCLPNLDYLRVYARIMQSISLVVSLNCFSNKMV